MKLQLKRNQLIKPLAHLSSVVERRQTLPILSNVHLKLEDDMLSLTATDLEMEVIANITEVTGTSGEMTLSVRKLLDICRALPEGEGVTIDRKEEKAIVTSGKSRFILQTLPASDFPRLQDQEWEQRFMVRRGELKSLLDKTAFAMAQQDVRYYLNGLLLEFEEKVIRTVATDGHRLAKSELSIEQPGIEPLQLIVPRKAVLELVRFLEGDEKEVEIQINDKHIRLVLPDMIFTSKLIDGKYPDYGKVIPEGLSTTLIITRQQFKEILGRAAILTNDKFRGVRLTVTPGLLMVTAHNPEQEEASDEMVIDYDGQDLEVGFNVNYLIEAVNALSGEMVELSVRDQNSSCILRSPGDEKTLYLVMPMRL